jgi:hypothetical protein
MGSRALRTNFKGNVMLEAAIFYESLLNFYLNTRRPNPENSRLPNHPLENLRPLLNYLFLQCSAFSFDQKKIILLI